MALDMLMVMFRRSFRKMFRLYYLAMALRELLQNKSIVQSCKIIKACINTFNIDHEDYNQDGYSRYQEETLIQRFSAFEYMNQVVQILKNY